MDFIKGLISDSDKESDREREEGTSRENKKKMKKNYDEAEKFNRRKKPSGDSSSKTRDDPDVQGRPRRKQRSATVQPIPEKPVPVEEPNIPTETNIPMDDMAAYEWDEEDPEPEPVMPPPRPKSRAVVLPSGLIIGSEDDSTVHTSTLSSHSSDTFHEKKRGGGGGGLMGLVFNNQEKEHVEDAETGLVIDPRKSSVAGIRRRTLGNIGRQDTKLGRSVSAPAGAKLGLAERRTLRRAERVGLIEKKQLPFCTRISYEFTIAVQRTFRKLQEGTRDMQVWGKSIKEVEGNLGSGVSTYFRVLRWLLKINFICMVLALGLVVSPGIYISETMDNTSDSTSYNKYDLECNDPNFIDGTTTYVNVTNSIFQFLTGQGWMEATALFLGWYPANNITRDGGDETSTDDDKIITLYNFPLAYLIVGLSYFLVALLFICNNIARLFKKSAVESIETKVYANLVLAGWDHTISNTKTAQLKSATIAKSLREELNNDAQKYLKRSIVKQVLIFILRIFTYGISIGAMAGTVLLYKDIMTTSTSESAANLTDSCGETQTNITLETDDLSVEYVKELLVSIWSSYKASIIVSLSNIIFPIFFEILGKLELYRFQSTRITITIIRSFIMKVFNVVAFLYLLYIATKASGGKGEDWQTINNTLYYNCWENYIGAQLYQLCMIDFIVFVIALFIGEFFRNFLINHIPGISAKLQQPEFNISKEVLDLCYKQMIFWSGVFFAPLMTCVAVTEVIVIFYLKKFSALRNVRPPQKVVLTSQSSTMINMVFLISLFFVFIFLGIIIFRFTPSEHCGPFRGDPAFTTSLKNLIANSGVFKEHVYENLKMTAVVVTIIVVVALIIYYFKSLAASRNVTIKLLRQQIRVEHVDKQFLIDHIKSSITGKPVTATREGVMSQSSVGEGNKKKKKKKTTLHRFANPNMAV